LKQRLDTILVERGLFDSREKAKASVMEGIVSVNGLKAYKAGTMTDVSADITVKEDPCPYVGRGGLKLEKAMDFFDMDMTGAVTADIGASTGGFTDCMLQHGARKVYAIDVGYGQLAWKLRKDPRVINMEKTNARYLDCDRIPEPVDFITIDVSFISVSHILAVATRLLADQGSIICLVKPQFEAGRDQVGKKGIIKDEEVHKEVIRKVIHYGEETGLAAAGLTFSPVKGAKGNIEYLLYMKKQDDCPAAGPDIDIDGVVGRSHEII